LSVRIITEIVPVFPFCLFVCQLRLIFFCWTKKRYQDRSLFSY